MVRYYCPGCWKDSQEDFRKCPSCGLDIHRFWDSKDYAEKLIVSLRHPEPTTPIRAARLLGRLKDPRAVPALIKLIRDRKDLFVAGAAIGALGEIGTPEAVAFLESLLQSSDGRIRDLARKALGPLKTRRAPDSSHPHGKDST